jgi:hypothetical protein
MCDAGRGIEGRPDDWTLGDLELDFGLPFPLELASPVVLVLVLLRFLGLDVEGVARSCSIRASTSPSRRP